jgi:hypothetical protein
MKAINSKVRAAMLVVMLLCIVGIGAQTASAGNVVGTCMAGTQFSTIQDAVNNVVAGSTVFICPGTYPEQLRINRNMTLTGVASGTSDAVIIVPPSGGLMANTTSLFDHSAIAAHVLADVQATVNMNNLIVDSNPASNPNNINACAPVLVGIFYRNTSGTLNHVVTRNQWVGASESDTNFNGCQTGLGIFAQSGSGELSTVLVENSSVHDYQKNGITGNEAGTTLNVTNTQVVGQGATNGAAENGIQIGFGASGSVRLNNVIDDVWAPDTSSDPGDAATGILLFDAATGVTVSSNTVGNTQFGIGLETDTAGLGDGEAVNNNKVIGTRIFDGIDVCTNGNTIHANTVVNSTESAIHLDASCGAAGGGGTGGNNNTVTNNIVSDAAVGILKDAGTSGNTTTPNTFSATGTTDPAGTARGHIPSNPIRP